MKAEFKYLCQRVWAEPACPFLPSPLGTWLPGIQVFDEKVTLLNSKLSSFPHLGVNLFMCQ